MNLKKTIVYLGALFVLLDLLISFLEPSYPSSIQFLPLLTYGLYSIVDFREKNQIKSQRQMLFFYLVHAMLIGYSLYFIGANLIEIRARI